MVAVAAGWVVVVAVVAVAAAPDAATVLVLATMGLIVVGGMQLHRQHRGVLGALRAAAESSSPFRPEPARQDGAAATGEVLDRVKLTALSLGRLSEDLAAVTERVRQAVTAETQRVTRRLEALQSLHAAIPVAGPVPPAPGSGSSPEVTVHVVDLLRRDRPRLVVECGGGISVLWCALAARQFQLDTRIVALEPDEQIARDLTARLEASGVGDLAEVRHAPVEPVEVDGETVPWYARRAWADLVGIGLVSVHRAPADAGGLSVSPALRGFADHLADHAAIVLDGVVREHEPEAVEKWLATTAAASSEPVPLEPGPLVLRHHTRRQPQ